VGKSQGEHDVKILEEIFRRTGYEDVNWIEIIHSKIKW
jgi:hypothetical protein